MSSNQATRAPLLALYFDRDRGQMANYSDTWRVALELVKRHGREAASIAAGKADALIAHHEYIAAASWIGIQSD